VEPLLVPPLLLLTDLEGEEKLLPVLLEGEE
jgi:hypothetical protein